MPFHLELFFRSNERMVATTCHRVPDSSAARDGSQSGASGSAGLVDAVDQQQPRPLAGPADQHFGQVVPQVQLSACRGLAGPQVFRAEDGQVMRGLRGFGQRVQQYGLAGAGDAGHGDVAGGSE